MKAILHAEGGSVLELDEEGQELVQRLGAAINSAIERSGEVSDAIASLREAGYEMELNLKLEIGLRRHAEPEEENENSPLELTDEDRRTLRDMRIRFDEPE